MKQEQSEAPQSLGGDAQRPDPSQAERAHNPFREEVPASRVPDETEASEREQQRKEALTERD
ncbi:MAG: hypothetical protein EOO16_11710 [Chitinophagaceae bacterium]|nr:MAG: hypothetical protein EOO16_11710 [Chitinophagaceae bacterium]